MADASGRKMGFFAKIREQEDAVKIVHAASLAFIVAGLFFSILSYWYGPELWMDGLAYIVLAFLLRQFKSRMVAVLLLLLAVVTGALLIGIFSRNGSFAGMDVILAGVLFFIGLRAVEATHKLRARRMAAVPAGDA
jgi:hypothetical protein